MAEYRKSGNGAFLLEVAEADRRVTAQRGSGMRMTFENPQAAYDYYRYLHDCTSDHAAWNICYHLEDHIHA